MARRKRGGLTRMVSYALVAAACIGAWYVYGSYAGHGGGAALSNTAARVVVPRGATVRDVARRLADAGAIRAARLFRTYASVGGRDRLIKPGTYAFERNAGWKTALEALVAGRGIVNTVIIPEGFDLRAIVPLLARSLDVPEDSVRAAATDTAWQHKLDVPLASLEGYLFPATYTFAEGTTAREAVNAMLEKFEAEWAAVPDATARLQALAITRHDAITMASIVETEAKRAEERPIIAAVYWNRIRKGMRLQADPTVQYALPAHVGRVLFKDLTVESRFNTYKYEGLPPGPIASPGRAAIQAALNPATVPYLYFVAHSDGHHEFRTTFSEHEKAIAMLKRERAASGAQGKSSNAPPLRK